MCSRHSIFCILPPHMLRSIAEHGNPEERAAASGTLAVDATFRVMRATSLAYRAAPRTLIVQPAVKQRTIYTAQNQQQLPGTVVASEKNPPASNADVAVAEAFN